MLGDTFETYKVESDLFNSLVACICNSVYNIKRVK